MKIIDTHAFYGLSPVVNIQGIREEYTLDDFLKVQKQYPEDDIKFIVIPANTALNSTIGNIAAKNRNVISGAYLFIIPKKNNTFEYTSPKDIEKLASGDGIIGLKVISPFFGMTLDDNRLQPYNNIASNLGLAFLYHCSLTGNDYTSLKHKLGLIRKNPGLKIILAHMGGALYNDELEQNIQLAMDYDNVFMNTSGISGEHKILNLDITNERLIVNKHYSDRNLRKRGLEIIQYALEHAPTKILSGTDYPFLRYDMHPIDQLKKESQERLYQNAKDALNLSKDTFY